MGIGRDVYLLYGWKAGPESLKSVLTEMTPEVLATELRVVFGRDARKGAFVGKVLARFDQDAGPESAGAPLPDVVDLGRLREGMRMLKLDDIAQATPMLWAIVG